MNLPWTHTGLPVITLPAGWTDNGLPLGLQFITPFGADELLLSWSRMLADRLKVDAPPAEREASESPLESHKR